MPGRTVSDRFGMRPGGRKLRSPANRGLDPATSGRVSGPLFHFGISRAYAYLRSPENDDDRLYVEEWLARLKP